MAKDSVNVEDKGRYFEKRSNKSGFFSGFSKSFCSNWFFFFWTPKSKVSKVVVASLVLCIGTQSSCKISIDEAENVFGKIRPKSSKTAQKRAKWNCRDLITSHSSLSTKELSCVKMNLLWFFFSRVWFYYMYVHKSGQILQYLSNHIPIQ